MQRFPKEICKNYAFSLCFGNMFSNFSVKVHAEFVNTIIVLAATCLNEYHGSKQNPSLFIQKGLLTVIVPYSIVSRAILEPNNNGKKIFLHYIMLLSIQIPMYDSHF